MKKDYNNIFDFFSFFFWSEIMATFAQLTDEEFDEISQKIKINNPSVDIASIFSNDWDFEGIKFYLNKGIYTKDIDAKEITIMYLCNENNKFDKMKYLINEMLDICHDNIVRYMIEMINENGLKKKKINFFLIFKDYINELYDSLGIFSTAIMCILDNGIEDIFNNENYIDILCDILNK